MRRRIWLLIGLVLLLAAGAWPGYRWWVQHRSEHFQAACSAAVDAGEWKKLDELARDWLKFDEKSGDAWHYLARAAQKQGDNELAAECLAKLDDDHPKCLDALFDRLGILLKLNRVVEAEATGRRILKINPAADRAHSRLIFIYAYSLRRQKLREQIRESLSRGCEPPEAYAYLFTSAQPRFPNGEAVNAG